MKLKDVSKIEAHLMQFTVWRFSPKARMLQEFIYTFIFTVAVDTYVNAFLNLMPPLAEFETQLFEMEAKLAGIEDTSSPAYLVMEAKALSL